MPRFAFPPQLQAARDTCDNVLRNQLQSWLALVEEKQGFQPCRNYTGDQAASGGGLGAAVAVLHQSLDAASGEEPAAWPAVANRLFLAEVESYHRLSILARELDQHFTNKTRPEPR